MRALGIVIMKIAGLRVHFLGASSDSYSSLQKTIGIHVLNFSLLDEVKYHNVFHIVNKDNGKKFSDMLELHYIELPKVPTDFSYIFNTLDRWSAFLARAEKYTATTLPDALSSDPMICKAMEKLCFTFSVKLGFTQNPYLVKNGSEG